MLFIYLIYDCVAVGSLCECVIHPPMWLHYFSCYRWRV